MNGGKINNNFATMPNQQTSNKLLAYGGGIIVDSNATFTMYGGEISGNLAGNTGNIAINEGSGGGVFVYGTFIMNGGLIDGNTTRASLSRGGGVLLSGAGKSFIKTPRTGSSESGIITGHLSDSSAGFNVTRNAAGAVVNNSGHAVWVNFSSVRRKENTAGPPVHLDSSKTGAAGGWDN